jgi:hypothetical protein
MIPVKSHPVWAQLVKGTTEHSFKLAACSMLLFNIRSQFKKDPSRLNALVEDVHKFFSKYELAMADDIKMLFGKH